MWGGYLESEGYRVIHLDFIHPGCSDRYNPLKYIKSTNDIQKLANQIVYSSTPNDSDLSNDPFWDRTAELFISSMLGYLMELPELDGKFGTLNDISDLMKKINPGKWEDNKDCELDKILSCHNMRYSNNTMSESWGYSQYLKFRQTPPRTMGCVLTTVHSIISIHDTPEIQNLMSDDVVDITSIGNKKTAVFIEISDTDRSKDFLANQFYSQAMNVLCNYADECKDSRLPVPVRFILDDFATNCQIEGFENMISNIRSREISAVIMLQSMSQLIAGYGKSAHTIMDNCDTMVYMGGNDVDTAEMLSKRCNKPISRFLGMPVGTNWIVRSG